MFVQRVKPEDSFADGPQQLQKCREQINQAKQQIAGEIARDGAKAWDTATSWMELSRPLAQQLRGQHDIPKNASNAFFKGIELFNLVGPFLKSCDEIKIFDNASLPGDFIRAMQWWSGHRAGKLENGNFPKVDWRANSLVGGLDDRFGLLRDHPERWMMCPATFTTPAQAQREMTGDVTDPQVCDEIMRRLGDWRADIYTSDLGFAVKSYFHEEEEHFAAHSAQCYLGMRILRRGGAMIVKTFTMSTLTTVGLISHLMDMFDEFYIVKPATSKPDNSECYWVCLGYLGEDARFARWQNDRYGSRTVYYPRALIQAQQLLAKRQAQKITQNVLAFRRRNRAGPDFSAAITRWCAQHIGADTGLSGSSAEAPKPQPAQ